MKYSNLLWKNTFICDIYSEMNGLLRFTLQLSGQRHQLYAQITKQTTYSSATSWWETLFGEFPS